MTKEQNAVDFDKYIAKRTRNSADALASQTPTPPGVVTDVLECGSSDKPVANANPNGIGQNIPESAVGPTSETGSIPAGAGKFSELVAPIGCLVAYHEKEAHDHVSSQWIYSNHMMAVGAYKKVLQMIVQLGVA